MAKYIIKLTYSTAHGTPHVDVKAYVPEAPAGRAQWRSSSWPELAPPGPDRRWMSSVWHILREGTVGQEKKHEKPMPAMTKVDFGTNGEEARCGSPCLVIPLTASSGTGKVRRLHYACDIEKQSGPPESTEPNAAAWRLPEGVSLKLGLSCREDPPACRPQGQGHILRS